LIKTPLNFSDVDQGEEVISQRELITSSGAIVPIITNSKLLNNSVYISTVKNISDIKEAQKQLLTSERSLRNIIHRTSNVEGQEYFDQMCLALADSTKANMCIIATLENDVTLKSLSYYKDGELQEPIEFNRANTPCDDLLKTRKSIFINDVDLKFPGSQIIQDNGYKSYLGTPIIGEYNNIIGVLICLYKENIPNNGLQASILEVFSNSVSNEIKRLNAHKALQYSEELYRNVVDNSIEGIFVLQNGKFVFANNSILELSGYSMYEVQHLSFMDVVHPDDVELIIENNKKRIAGEHLPNYDFRLIHKNKDIIWLTINATKIEWESETAILCFVNDITERKIKEQKIADSQVLLESVIENIPYDFWARDKDGVCFLQNNLSRSNWGEMIGNTPEEQDISLETLARWIENNEKAYNGEIVSREVELQDANDKIRYFHNIIAPIYDQNQEVNGILGMNIDISRRRESEMLVQKHNSRLYSLLKISHYQYQSKEDLLNFALFEAIEFTQSKMACLYLYDSKTKLFHEAQLESTVISCPSQESGKHEFSVDEMYNWQVQITQSIGQIDNDVQANIDKYSLTAGVASMTRQMSIPVLNDDGQLVALVGVANKEFPYNEDDLKQFTLLMQSVWQIVEKIDYTEKLIEAKEKAEENDSLKSAFLANMSHEIRTPMNGIIGFAELLKAPGYSVEQRDSFISIINKNGKRLLRIVDDILDISKIETSQLTIIKKDIAFIQMLAESESQHRSKALEKGLNLKFVTDALPKDLKIHTDKTRLLQVFDNLISNAIKFTDSGGITVDFKLLENEIEVKVKDTGIGVPHDMHDRVFDRFMQARPTEDQLRGGTGLGLSITKGLVNLLGGKIRIEKQAVGTCFAFTIPCDYQKEHKPTNHYAIASEKIKLNTNAKIVIAEDEESNIFYLQELLKMLGFHNTLWANTGKECLEIVADNPDTALVLMDIKMPDMNGYEATEELKKLYPEIPVIIQTAYAMQNDAIKAFSIGADDFISKPINTEVLKNKINKHLK
jgi:PAS domain S-box-containing protein